MSHTLKYVGKKSEYAGKTLWEILGNLKNFGVGRIILRNSQAKRYSEPCYMKILEVHAQPNYIPPKVKVNRPPNDLRDKDRPRLVYAQVEYVFRGVKYDEPVLLTGESSMPDYSLVPKHFEKNYVSSKTRSQMIEENILPRTIDFPPLLEEMIVKNGNNNPKLTVIGANSPNALYRVANEGEKPTKQFPIGFGTPKSPNLYKNVNYDI